VNRRDLFRTTILGAAASAGVAAREFSSDHDESKELTRPDWKPVFLDTHQNETLIALSEVIIPETDTAGAKTALVNRFIDRLLAAETRERQRAFLDSLAFLDGETFARYKLAFVHLRPEQQREVVTFMAWPHTLVTWQDNQGGAYPGHEHFRTLKEWIAKAYFSSEAGMRALGYDGPSHGVFEGCTHPEGHK
jgi:hypothetical protein